VSAVPSSRFVASSSMRFAIDALTFSSLMDGDDDDDDDGAASARVVMVVLEVFKLAKVTRIAAVDAGAASF